MVAATTNHITIHGKFVPGKGAKIRLTNGPVTLANTEFTFWSSVIASSAKAELEAIVSVTNENRIV